MTAMPSSEKKSKLPVFTIITVLTFAFMAIYFVSTDTYRLQSEARQKRIRAINSTSELMKKNGQIVLQRDVRKDIGRTSLIYKGIEDEKIVVDLFLLDLDSQQGYLKRIDKEQAKMEFDLGRVKYSLISANKNYLTMKILSMSQTP